MDNWFSQWRRDKDISVYSPHVLTHSHLMRIRDPETAVIKEYSIEELQKEFGVTYVSRPVYANKKVYKRIKKQSAQALASGRLEEENKWLGVLHGKEIETGQVNRNMIVEWIDEKIGYGVFAGKDLPAWEFIGQYAGLIRQKSFFFPSTNDYCFSYPTSSLHFRKHTIDAETYGNEIRFINHSDKGNCESATVWHKDMLFIILRTKQAIPKGEQLTYDYSEIYWRSRKKMDL